MPETLHRADLGRDYKGLSVHAAPGVHEHTVKMVERLAPPKARILEVGAGSGALALRLKDIGLDITATDLEPTQEWVYQFDLDDPEGNPAVTGPFDFIICVETIEHLENPRSALRLMRSLLTPGGTLLLSTPNVSHPHSRIKFLRKTNVMAFDPDAYYYNGHITVLPQWLLVEHLKHSGFKVQTIEYAGVMEFRTRRRRLIHQVEMTVLRWLGIHQPITADDGLCVFIAATVAP